MVRDWFEIGINFLEQFIILRFISLYLGFRYKGIKRYLSFGISWLVSTSVITVLNYTVQYEGILGLVFMGIFFLYALLFLEGSVTMKLFVSGFIDCIVYLISMCTGLVISILGQYGLNNMFLELGVGRMLWIILTKLILIAVTQLLLKYKFDPYIKSNNIWLLIVVPAIAMLTISILMSTSLSYPDLQIPMLLASVSVILSSVLTYYIYIKISRDSRIKAEYSILRESYEMEKRNIQNVKELYDSACGIRHDIKQHLQTINSLMHDNVDTAEHYINDLMKNQIEPVLSFIKTDNITFDAIVNTKLTICKNLNIKTDLRIMKHSLDPMSSDEIGVLFGNLFDNAIEAAKDTKEKSIVLEVQKQEGYISIFMSNSIDRSVIDRNEELKTTKEDAELHGYGIKNIRKIVEKRDGIIEFFEENGRFCCDILL